MSASQAIAIDILNGAEQSLIFEQKDGGILIPGFLLKDYAQIIKLKDNR